jgi:hypothetical protein
MKAAQVKRAARLTSSIDGALGRREESARWTCVKRQRTGLSWDRSRVHSDQKLDCVRLASGLAQRSFARRHKDFSRDASAVEDGEEAPQRCPCVRVDSRWLSVDGALEY